MSPSSNLSLNNRPISARRPGARYLIEDAKPKDSSTEFDFSSTSTDLIDSDSTEDSDNHTLSAYGEISLSNQYLIPSAETEVSPSKRGTVRFEPGKPAFPRRVSRLTFGSIESSLRAEYFQRRSGHGLSPKLDIESLVKFFHPPSRVEPVTGSSPMAESGVEPDERSEGTSSTTAVNMKSAKRRVSDHQSTQIRRCTN